MGLDLYAACKTVDGIKTEPTTTVTQEFPHIPPRYNNKDFFRLRHFDPRRLVRTLSNKEGCASFAERFFGDLPGERHYFPDESIAEMPQNLDDRDLPPVMSPQEALSLADDIADLDVEGIPAAIEYLRFWGTRGHPILCSY